MRLLFKRNKFVSYVKQSGQLCPGFNKCVHPGSVVNTEMENFKGGPKIPIALCPFKTYSGPYSVSLSNYTKEEWEELERKSTFCWHPKELTPVHEWRCYKCNAIVKSERERHKCK